MAVRGSWCSSQSDGGGGATKGSVRPSVCPSIRPSVGPLRLLIFGDFSMLWSTAWQVLALVYANFGAHVIILIIKKSAINFGWSTSSIFFKGKIKFGGAPVVGE